MKALLAGLLLLAGCNQLNQSLEPPKIESQTVLGKILDASAVTTSFNACQKMQIKTEKMVVIIAGYTSVPVGQEALLYQYTDGSQAIDWEGGYPHPIY